MDCKIENSNIKVFIKLIQTLSKLGYELVMEAYDDHLCIRVVDEKKTGFAVCKLVTPFFKEYESSGLPDNSPFICKVLIKHVIGVFKNIKQLEKQIEEFTIKSSVNSTILVFKFRYKCESSKLQKIFLTEGEFLRISTPNDAMSNTISGSATLFANILTNFQHSDEEITFIVKPDSLVVRNYHGEEPAAPRSLNSYYSLSTKAFESYNVKETCKLTFPMKPFRAAVQLAEFVHATLHMLFHKPGMPIIINFTKNTLFEIAFTFSTMAGTDGVWEPKDNYEIQHIQVASPSSFSMESNNLSMCCTSLKRGNGTLAKEMRKGRKDPEKKLPKKNGQTPDKSFLQRVNRSSRAVPVEDTDLFIMPRPLSGTKKTVANESNCNTKHKLIEHESNSVSHTMANPPEQHVPAADPIPSDETSSSTEPQAHAQHDPKAQTDVPDTNRTTKRKLSNFPLFKVNATPGRFKQKSLESVQTEYVSNIFRRVIEPPKVTKKVVFCCDSDDEELL